MAYYSNQTFEAIRDRMMNRAPADVDRRENSSVLYNAIAPAAAEIATEYTELETIRNDMSIYTATDEGVVKKCADRLISRKPGTAARVLGKFNLDSLPAGLRFSHDAYNYTIIGINTGETEQRGDAYYYDLVCETPGAAPSDITGYLIPIKTIRGLEIAEIVECISAGSDEQSIESLRQAYIDSFSTTAFGGNVASYRTEMAKRSDVGSCLVHTANSIQAGNPNATPAGTVRIVFTGANHGSPDQSVVDAVQNFVDPLHLDAGSVSSTATGRGLGIAPVGAAVTVSGAQATTIGFSAEFVVSGRTYAEVAGEIQTAVGAYLTDLNRSFGSASRQAALNISAATMGGLVVSNSQIVAAIINDVPAVTQINSPKIVANGTALNAGRNAVLGIDNIAALGTITNTGA